MIVQRNWRLSGEKEDGGLYNVGGGIIPRRARLQLETYRRKELTEGWESDRCSVDYSRLGGFIILEQHEGWMSRPYVRSYSIQLMKINHLLFRLLPFQRIQHTRVLPVSQTCCVEGPQHFIQTFPFVSMFKVSLVHIPWHKQEHICPTPAAQCCCSVA